MLLILFEAQPTYCAPALAADVVRHVQGRGSVMLSCILCFIQLYLYISIFIHSSTVAKFDSPTTEQPQNFKTSANQARPKHSHLTYHVGTIRQPVRWPGLRLSSSAARPRVLRPARSRPIRPTRRRLRSSRSRYAQSAIARFPASPRLTPPPPQAASNTANSPATAATSSRTNTRTRTLTANNNNTATPQTVNGATPSLPTSSHSKARTARIRIRVTTTTRMAAKRTCKDRADPVARRRGRGD